MIPSLKSCYVLLNRNFLYMGKTSTEVNNSPSLEMGNSEEYSNGNRIPDCKRFLATINKKNNYELREKGKINYSDDIKYTEGDDSCSEFSYDSSSSDGEEMTKEQKGRRRHDSSNTSPKKLSCLLCVDKSFSSHWSYLKHKRSHECNPYKCILCNMKFQKRQSYLLHMKRHHPEVEPFLCEYPRCEQSFKTQRLVEIHHKMHWKYMCKYCKKLFVRKHQMRKHILKIH
ncbi:Protein suppressor of hairy wing like protein [Argiope bruennichi]|uniref:Protein suppressor of hairy wing like protein n=1 Tax=Argiope bruennichi TaxID=94029 RepID=A0A8T0E2C5_ARGBR|nr:Protein suppressor of hairy wing like protein [Argiope bruennichi]